MLSHNLGGKSNGGVYLEIGTERHTEEILPLLEDLFNHSIYSNSMSFNPEDVTTAYLTIVRGLQKNGTVILLKEEQKIIGLLACSVVEQMFNRKERTAAELAFWVEPKYRSSGSLKALLKAYRFWAKKVGCTSVLLGKMKNSYEVETYTLRKLK